METINRIWRRLGEGPFVEQNGVRGWKLLERMAMMLRDARKG